MSAEHDDAVRALGVLRSGMRTMRVQRGGTLAGQHAEPLDLLLDAVTQHRALVE